MLLVVVCPLPLFEETKVLGAPLLTGFRRCDSSNHTADNLTDDTGENTTDNYREQISDHQTNGKPDDKSQDASQYSASVDACKATNILARRYE